MAATHDSTRPRLLRRVQNGLAYGVVDHDRRLEIADLGLGAVAFGDHLAPLSSIDTVGGLAAFPELTGENLLARREGMLLASTAIRERSRGKSG